MKKYITIFILFYILSMSVKAQQPLGTGVGAGAGLNGNQQDQGTGKNSTDTARVKPAYCAWMINPRFGNRIPIPADTAKLNFHKSTLIDGLDISSAFLSNVGSPYQSQIFMNRPEVSKFTFLDVMKPWIDTPENHLFFNTKIPYSDVLYQQAGGGEVSEKRLKVLLSSNFGKKINVGVNFDYIYSRGFYTNLANKGISYGVFGNYIGDREKLHVFASNDNFTYDENGGIKDVRYITEPDADDIKAQRISGNSQDIPVNYTNTWNRLRGRHIYVNNRYDIGPLTKRTDLDTTNQSMMLEQYIPAATIVVTSHYTDQRRRFNSSPDSKAALDSIYAPYYYDNKVQKLPKDPNNAIDDYMSYYAINNTAALSMNEGFKKWTKFGLTVFTEFNYRKYFLPRNNSSTIYRYGSETDWYIGGMLSKNSGKYIRYNVSAEKNLLRSDLNLQGEFKGIFPFRGKELSLKAKAYIKNTPPSFFQDHFATKYWSWDQNFKDTRRIYLGGELTLPSFSFSQTKFTGGVENLQNYIYYGSNRMAQQATGNIQVLTLRLDENLKAGILHWDNNIAYQTTSNAEALPLPKLSAFSNLYIRTKIAKVLTFQFGVDVHYYTKYYLPGYEPLTMQFYNQRTMEIGNFPLTSAYIDFHLKYTRFFVMMYNLTNGMGNAESFGAYLYPVNPRVVKLGLSWQFHN